MCLHKKGIILKSEISPAILIKTRMTFSSIKDKLKEDYHFLQLLRGVLVNMDYIVDFEEGLATWRKTSACRLMFEKCKED